MADERPVRMAEPRLEADEIEAAVRVLESGALRQGPVTKQFEDAFAAWYGTTHAYACSSGTAALHLAYLSVIEPGDEVLVPAFTFFASASAVVLAGGTPVFCDVDASTFTVDLASAEAAVTSRTKAFCAVYLFGQPIATDGLRAFAERHGLAVVGDAAQSLGTTWNGVGSGADATLTAHSFYPTKNLFVGEGGMVTTDDAGLDERGRLLRAHGQRPKYHHSVVGLNYRMTDVEAAIGLAQLPKVAGRNDRRRAIAARYDEAFAEVPGITVPALVPGGYHTYHQYTVVVDEPLTRDGLVEHLATAGIETQVNYPLPLHHQVAFTSLSEAPPPSLPVSEWLCSHVVSLPVHHHLSDDDVERVVRAVRQAGG